MARQRSRARAARRAPCARRRRPSETQAPGRSVGHEPRPEGPTGGMAAAEYCEGAELRPRNLRRCQAEIAESVISSKISPKSARTGAECLLPRRRRVTLADLEHKVAKTRPSTLMERFRACSKDGHAWRPLDAPELTPGAAEWCARCLRVRTGTFEGWFACASGAPAVVPDVRACHRVERGS
jgi:hypothetical protein